MRQTSDSCCVYLHSAGAPPLHEPPLAPIQQQKQGPSHGKIRTALSQQRHWFACGKCGQMRACTVHPKVRGPPSQDTLLQDYCTRPRLVLQLQKLQPESQQTNALQHSHGH